MHYHLKLKNSSEEITLDYDYPEEVDYYNWYQRQSEHENTPRARGMITYLGKQQEPKLIYSIQLHRLIAGCHDPNKCVIFKDGDWTNCTRANLEIVTRKFALQRRINKTKNSGAHKLKKNWYYIKKTPGERYRCFRARNKDGARRIHDLELIASVGIENLSDMHLNFPKKDYLHGEYTLEKLQDPARNKVSVSRDSAKQWTPNISLGNLRAFFSSYPSKKIATQVAYYWLKKLGLTARFLPNKLPEITSLPEFRVGVAKLDSTRYRVFKNNNRKREVSYFKTEEEARDYYDQLTLKYTTGYPKLNYPNKYLDVIEKRLRVILKLQGEEK